MQKSGKYVQIFSVRVYSKVGPAKPVPQVGWKNTTFRGEKKKRYPVTLVFQNPPNTLWVGVWNP